MNVSLWKVKQGKRQLWIDWTRSIRTVHREEAMATLPGENLVAEQCQLFDVGNESYVVYLHTPIQGKTKLPADRTINLNKVHLDIFKECLEPTSFGDNGYSIKL